MPTSAHLGPRIILRETEPELRLGSFAAAFGWDKTVHPEDPQAGTLREVVWEGYDTGLHFIVDDATGCPYLYFSTGTANDARVLTRMAAEQLEVYSREELLASFDAAHDAADRRRALLMAALGSSHTFDQDLHQRISDAARAPEADLRSAAIYAMSYSPSVRFKPLLGRLSADDPNPGIRQDAGLMLEVFGEVGTGGG
ncbi:hypothetical protein [Spirillospora sp. NBC_01491]|uniref:hypothetical protein n=1 Tax=Spirillospora sp. NBC_01491 TaxID=2976007 RepID=UPI002E3349D1|nr:hypothetical protein [Spirillospora sp. NBC_01491]